MVDLAIVCLGLWKAPVMRNECPDRVPAGKHVGR